jgi:hypothetical protein
MTGPDLHDDLRALVAVAEREAVPADPGLVRRRGERRRHRRYALTAVAATAVVALAGGVALGQLPDVSDREPAPVASAPSAVPAPRPSSSAAAPRTVGPTQLLRPGDVPTRGGPRLEIAPAGSGRDLDEISVCVPGRLAELGATGTATRDFRYPGQEVSAVQTVALQFTDEAAARRAEQSVRGWVDGCATTIEEKGGTLVDPRAEPVRVEVETPSGTSGEFAALPVYRQEGGESSGEGIFESLGVTRVADRVMLTVDVVVGMDDNVSLEPGGDPANGMPEHPQFGLVRAAAERLAVP